MIWIIKRRGISRKNCVFERKIKLSRKLPNCEEGDKLKLKIQHLSTENSNFSIELTKVKLEEKNLAKEENLH